MGPKDVEQFTALGAALFAGCQTLSDAFLEQLDLARRATDEVVDKLSAGGAAAAGTPEIVEHYDEAASAQRLLYERSRSIAVEVSARLTACLERPVPHETGPRAPLEAAFDAQALPKSGLAEKRANLAKFDMGIAQFFTGAALITLDSTFATSIDTCEAFLGRTVGSHEAASRMRRVGEAFVVDLASFATKFPFFATTVEIVRQWRYDPQLAAQQEEIRTGEGMAKVVNFKHLVQRLSDDGINHAAGMINTSLSAVEECSELPAISVFALDAVEEDGEPLQ
jgi:hypothetical protein